MAKAPSLRKDWSKGTQRTRKLSTGKALWMLEKCEGTLQGVEPWRRTAGVEPGAVKVACRVLNGGDEETCMLQRALSLPNGKGGLERLGGDFTLRSVRHPSAARTSPTRPCATSWLRQPNRTLLGAHGQVQ